MGSEKLRESGLLKPKIEIKDPSCQLFTPIADPLTATVTLWDLHSIPASCNSSIGGSACWSAAVLSFIRRLSGSPGHRKHPAQTDKDFVR